MIKWVYLYSLKSETLLRLAWVGFQLTTFWFFGQTTKPSCLEALQEHSCLPRLMILPGGVQGVSIAQALRMPDAQADFIFFVSNLRHHWVWSWVRFELTTYKQIMVEGLLSIFAAPDLVLLETIDIEMKYNAHFPLVEKKKEETNNYMYFFFIYGRTGSGRAKYLCAYRYLLLCLT